MSQSRSRPVSPTYVKPTLTTTGTEVGICGSGPQGTAYEWGYLMQTAFVSNSLKVQVNKACDWEAAVKNEKDAISAGG